MQKKNRGRLQTILIDILGLLLIVAAAPVGLIPGPGGLILFAAGLGLLASNHVWAENLLLRVKDEGGKIGEIIFQSNPKIQLLIDLLSIGLLAGGIYLAMEATGLLRTASVSLIILGTILLFGNRHRFKKLTAKFKKTKA